MRIAGSYGTHKMQPPFLQSELQVPQDSFSWGGWQLPEREATQVQGQDGAVLLYVSASGEVPLYYSLFNSRIYWHEQSLAIPGKAELVQKGQAVVWNGQIKKHSLRDLPRPRIREDLLTEDRAIQEYAQLLIAAVERRLGDRKRVAIAQSAGLDSFLVLWALQQLGVEAIPITVGTDFNCWDISSAAETLATIGIAHYPVIVSREQMPELFKEAVLCLEEYQAGNLTMAACNIAIARQCREMGIDLILTGHGHDDLHGSEGLIQGDFKRLPGNESERWRDARRAGYGGIGMEKMFSSTFRRYGICCRTPFLDVDLLNWAFSLPTSVIPPVPNKPLARKIARALLPATGAWNRPKYLRRGYITGAGMYEAAIKATVGYSLDQAKDFLRHLKSLPWQERAEMHLQQ